MSSGREKDKGQEKKKNMIFIESYPNVQHSKIKILAYRAIGVITVNLQHNLPKWVCVVVSPLLPPHPPKFWYIWFMSCCSVTSECGSDFNHEWSNFWFIFHLFFLITWTVVLMSCFVLNLVHKKLRKSFHCWKWLQRFSLSLFFFFWSMIFSRRF